MIKQKKLAIQDYQRDANGVLKIVLLDLDTGKPIAKKNESSYKVVTQDELDQDKLLGIDPRATDKTDSGVTKAPVPYIPTARTLGQSRGEKDSSKTFGSGSSSGTGINSPLNDSNYIDKPGWAKYAGVAAGLVNPMLGAAVSGVDLGVNAKNEALTKSARKMLGIEGPSLGGTAKSLIKGNEGFVGDKKIGGKTYGVSYKAMTPDNRSALDPYEALQRQDAVDRLAHPEKYSVNTNTVNKSFAKLHPELDPQTLGFGTQSPQVKSEVGYIENYGPKRPDRPSQDVIDAAKASVGRVYGPGYSIVGTSGKGEFGSPRHREKMGAHALDLSVQAPDGSIVSDPAKMADLAVDFAEHNPTAGIGYSAKGYMGAKSIHFDLSGMGGEWGIGETKKGMDPALAARIDAARQNPVTSPLTNPADTALASIADTTNLPDNATAGMKNFNPGNLKYDPNVAWNGLVGPSVNTDQGTPQAVFASPEMGMRAMAKLSLNKYDAGMTTLRDIIAGPKGWTPGYLTAAENIAKTMGIGIDDNLNLTDPAQHASFMRGLLTQEQGPASVAYTDDMINAGITALNDEKFGIDVKPNSFASYTADYYKDKGYLSRFDGTSTGANRPATGNISNPSQMGGTGMSSGLPGSFGSGSNRPATGSNNSSNPSNLGGINMNSGNLSSNYGSHPASNPSTMGGTSMSSGYANTTGSNNPGSNPSNMGGTSMSSGVSHNTQNFGGTSGTNPSNMGGTSMSSGYSNNNKSNEGATGRYGSSSFGGPR